MSVKTTNLRAAAYHAQRQAFSAVISAMIAADDNDEPVSSGVIGVAIAFDNLMDAIAEELKRERHAASTVNPTLAAELKR